MKDEHKQFRVIHQVCTILLVTGFVVLFELVLYLIGVVPYAYVGMKKLLQNSSKAKRNKTTLALDGYLAIAEGRERPLVEQNNRACVMYGLLVGVAPLLLFAVVYSQRPDLRASRMREVWRDVAISLVFILLFQVCFLFLGRNWFYPGRNVITHEISKQYASDAVADGRPAKVDDRWVGVFRGGV